MSDSIAGANAQSGATDGDINFTIDTAVEPPLTQEPQHRVSPRRAFLANVHIGEVFKARVWLKDSPGAFMTVGDNLGRGLLHISEMPGDRRQRDEFLEGLRRGQELTVEVISIDWKRARVGLSLIASAKERFFSTLDVGSLVEGTVSTVESFGAFINFDGICGLLHVSEMPGRTREERDANLAALQEGDKIELVAFEVNRQLRQARYSLRRVAVAKLAVGTAVHGNILQVRRDAVVVELDVGGHGLLPRDYAARYERGQQVTATVLSVDVAHYAAELDW